MKFSELITAYVIKTEKDAIRHNSRDDYGVYPMIFIGGGYVDHSGKPVWTTAWGLLAEEQRKKIEPTLAVGTVNSISFLYLNGEIRATAVDSHMIGHRALGTVEEFPAALEFAVQNHPSKA